MTPSVIADLQERYKALREGGIGNSKSAAIEEMADELGNAIKRGFLKRQVWAALQEVGYEGGYDYFARKLDRLGITRRQLGMRLLTSRAPLRKMTDVLAAVAEKEEARSSPDPKPLDEVEAQRRRLEEARRRGDIYRNPKPEPKKIFVFNREQD
jgi:hypothetical protein